MTSFLASVLLWSAISGQVPAETAPAPVTPVVAPAPIPPAIAITATPQVPLGHWVRIKVVTDGQHPRVRVRQVLPGEDTYLPADDGTGTTGILKLAEGSYVLSWSQGEFAIEADAQTPGGTITAIAKAIIGDPLPPPDPGPDPPPPRTLADLAGAQAPALAKAYSELAEAFSLFTSVKHFHDTEALLLSTRGLTGHGATAAIAARLNVETLDALKPALTLVVAELGSPTPPTPTTGPRNVYIIRETEDSTPAIANLLTSLRTGAAEAYLTSKQHTLWILDDDATNPDGTPSPAVQQWLAKLEGTPIPALIVADKENKLLSKQPLPTTVDGVLDALQKAGG